jgi:hypothetical protein
MDFEYMDAVREMRKRQLCTIGEANWFELRLEMLHEAIEQESRESKNKGVEVPCYKCKKHFNMAFGVDTTSANAYICQSCAIVKHRCESMFTGIRCTKDFEHGILCIGIGEDGVARHWVNDRRANPKFIGDTPSHFQYEGVVLTGTPAFPTLPKLPVGEATDITRFSTANGTDKFFQEQKLREDIRRKI